MTGFGDAEPEDAWHPDDPLPELVDNLRRRVAALAELAVEGRNRQRLELIAGDLAHVIARLAADDG